MSSQCFKIQNADNDFTLQRKHTHSLDDAKPGTWKLTSNDKTLPTPSKQTDRPLFCDAMIYHTQNTSLIQLITWRDTNLILRRQKKTTFGYIIEDQKL